MFTVLAQLVVLVEGFVCILLIFADLPDYPMFNYLNLRDLRKKPNKECCLRIHLELG